MNKLVQFVPLALALVAPLLPCSRAEAKSADITIDPVAQLVNPNVLLVSGTVSCAHEGQMFTLALHVTQGDTHAYSYAYFTCQGSDQQAFSMGAMSYDGTHQKGKAHVYVDASYWDDGCHDLSADGDADVVAP